jgi:quercetin dioxygenase-like cupin family protein
LQARGVVGYPQRMAFSVASFGEQPWTPGAHPLERKKVAPPGMTLLRFEVGFEDPNWCTRSHVLFIVEGALSVELETQTVVVSAGDAIALDPGTRHRVAVIGSEATTVFALSELEQFAPRA